MQMSEDCEYKKAYIRMVLRMKEYISIVKGFRGTIDQLNKALNNNNNKQCSCNNGPRNNCETVTVQRLGEQFK